MDRLPATRFTFATALAVATLGLVAITSVPARSTPEAATWRRETLLGENATCFIRWVATSAQPGSHSTFTETLTLERVRKNDLQVLERTPLREATYTEVMDSLDVWRESAASRPAFDLAAYLSGHHVHVAFADDLIENREFAIDTAGVWGVFVDGRTRLLTREELLRQIPELGEEPRVVGIEQTAFRSPRAKERKAYLRVWSNTTAVDDFWSECLLMIPAELLH